MIPTLLAGGAGIALAASLWQIGTRVRALESLRADSSGAGAPPATPERSSKPMLAALYREPAPSPLSGLTSLPGGTWLGASLLLAIVGLSLSGFTPAKAPVPLVAPDSMVLRLQQRVDSLGLVVTALRDSVRLVATSAEPVQRANSPTNRKKDAPRHTAGSIPAAPSFPAP